MRILADANVPEEFVAALRGDDHEVTGGDVRTAVASVEMLPFDPAETDPIWLSGV